LKLLELKKEIDDMISNAFQNDMRFQKARDVAFQNFMNEFDKTPQYIAFYMNNEFVKGFKQLSENEIEVKIEAVIKLFCCLHGRDVFIASYSNLLANRLLNKTSVSDSAEQRMIQQLQVECGHNTVSKMKTMFQDIIKSQQTMKDFRQTSGNSNFVDNIEYSAEILTSGHWPFQEAPVCKIPARLMSLQNKFSSFYVNKFQNRKITYVYNHGNLQLETTYLKKKYQLKVNCFQATVLCLFNDSDELTVAQAKEKSQLSDKDFNESVLKLCNPKTKLISKGKPKVPKLDDPNEKLQLNGAFESNSVLHNVIPQPNTIKMAREGAGGVQSMSQVD